MKSASDKPLKGMRILVAEDDPVLAFDIVGVLLKAGAHVAGPAFSLERALELAKERFDCGVLDVSLRDGLVFPAAELLRKTGAGIVFYTGQIDPGRLRREWPDAEVLTKPAPFESLLGAVVKACRHSS